MTDTLLTDFTLAITQSGIERDTLLYDLTDAETVALLTPLLDKARAAGAAALEGYRAAAFYIAADSWDGCSDCMEMLRLARSVDDIPSWTPDETAAAMSRLRARAGQNPPQSGA